MPEYLCARSARVATLTSVFLVFLTAAATDAQQADTWPGFRGADGGGTTVAGSLAGADTLALEVAWKRPLGSGYSGVSVSAHLAVTMFVDGDQDVIAAFDPASGDELWRVPIGPSYPGQDGSFPGPMSTPVLVDNLVVGLSPWGRLFAIDRLDGEPVWTVELTEEHGAVQPEYGFATSPLLHDGVLVVQMGAADGAIAGFDPLTGALLWTVGSDEIAYQSPVVMKLRDGDQVVAAGMTELFGIDVHTGDIRWQVAHGGDGYLGVQSLVPVAAGEDRVFLAFKDQSSTVVALDGATASAAPLWEERSIRNSYAVPVYHDGYVYGFSSRFLTAVDANTGEAAWKSRPPGDGFPILVDGHLVVLTKDGSLHLIEATPEEYREKAGIEVFDDLAWMHPSYAMGSIFVRSIGEIARVDIVRGVRMATEVSYDAGLPPPDSEFAAFLARVEEADDKVALIDEYLADREFPIIEGNDLAHFVYRGPGQDLALAGDMIGSRQEARMHRVAGTDLFHFSARLLPDARLNYRFVRDFEDIVDPRNPRRTTSFVYVAEMAIADPGDSSEMSWMAMPEWRRPDHLDEPAAATPRGRLVEGTFHSNVLDELQAVRVYLPPGYEWGEQRYPVAYFHSSLTATVGGVPVTLDNLIGEELEPLIAVFFDIPVEGPEYSQVFADDLVPFVDGNYRTVAEAAGRASIGAGWGAFPALMVTFERPSLISKVGVQSLFMLDYMRLQLEPLIPPASEKPLDLYIDWGAYDAHNPQENWDVRDYSRNFAEYMRGRGYSVSGGEAHDSTDWDSWRNRNDLVLRALFSR